MDLIKEYTRKGGLHTGKCKIRNSWGVYDYYKYYRKNRPQEHKWVLTENQFYTLIRRINVLITEQIIKNERISLPLRMGEIYAVKQDFKTWIDKETNKIKTSRPINWTATLALWNDDEQAYKDKIFLRSNDKYNVYIYYDKFKAYYTNMKFFSMDFNKNIRREIFQKIKGGMLELPYFEPIKTIYQNDK